MRGEPEPLLPSARLRRIRQSVRSGSGDRGSGSIDQSETTHDTHRAHPPPARAERLPGDPRPPEVGHHPVDGDRRRRRVHPLRPAGEGVLGRRRGAADPAERLDGRHRVHEPRRLRLAGAVRRDPGRARSRPRGRRARDRGLEDPRPHGGAAPRELVGDRPRGNADLLRFTVDDSDPEIAARLANAYAQAFTVYKANLDTAQLSQAREDLERRVARAPRRGRVGNRALSRPRSTARSSCARWSSSRPPTCSCSRRPAPARSHRPRSATRSSARSSGSCSGSRSRSSGRRSTSASGRRRRSSVASGCRSSRGSPSRRAARRRKRRLAMLHDPQDAYAEAVRRLRTNLEFANVDRGARVIMVTSAVEREGKSTTIANLAVALARSGRNVALVDLDLRQPVLAKYFDLQGQPGITDVDPASAPTSTRRSRRSGSRFPPPPRSARTARSARPVGMNVLTDGTAAREPRRARRHAGARPRPRRACAPRTTTSSSTPRRSSPSATR